MQATLTRFISALRKHDVRISTSETLDAMRALALIGYADRQLLKSALSAALAKTINEKSIFDYCFELFFGGNNVSDQASTPEDLSASQTSNADSHFIFDIFEASSANPELQAAIDKPLVNMLLDDSNDKLAAAITQAAADINIENLRHFTQTGLYSRRLFEQLNNDQIDQSLQELSAIQTPDGKAVAELLQQKKQQLRGQIKDYIDDQFLLTANAEGKKLREHNLRSTRLSALERHYFNDMQKLVQKIAKKLCSRHSRRQYIAQRGQLNIAKTLRKNIRHDGILFETHWKKKRKDQPKVIALCDVSNSVSAYAKFLLLFLYSLNDVLPKVRSFCFSNRAGEVTDLFSHNSAAQAIELAFKQWGQGSSDYGQSLIDFSNICLSEIDNNTTIIILGDGRNNKGDPRLDIMQSIYQRAKTVIWLNPERRSHWGTGDSEMLRYQTACHFSAQCQTLQQLERVMDQLLKLGK